MTQVLQHEFAVDRSSFHPFNPTNQISLVQNKRSNIPLKLLSVERVELADSSGNLGISFSIDCPKSSLSLKKWHIAKIVCIAGFPTGLLIFPGRNNKIVKL